jgi:hypothetical protein
MSYVNPTIAPLLWLLVFVFIVALIYAGTRWLEIEMHPKLLRVMIGLVVLIVIVVLIFWLLGILGFAPAAGPFRR